MNTAIILDTETTGPDAAIDQPIEVAYLKLTDDPNMIGKGIDGLQRASAGIASEGFYTCIESYQQRCKPSVPMTFGAMATHHILPEDLENEPSVDSIILPKVDYIIGHKVDFDWEIMGSPEAKLIDTLLLARVLWADGDSCSQSACLYRIDTRMARTMTASAHNAGADVRMCMVILDKLCEMLRIDGFERLHQLTEKAKYPSKFWFGKHYGDKILDVMNSDKGWCEWYLRQNNLDTKLVEILTGKVKPLELSQILSGEV